MKVRLSSRARHELDAALAHSAQSSPRAAEHLARRIEAATNSLSAFPNRGRPGPVADTREIIARGTPYILVYLVASDEVVVIRIRRTRQDPAPD